MTTRSRLPRSSNHAFSQALSLSFASWLHQFCGDRERTRERAEQAIALSEEQHFGFWVGWDIVLQGWAQAETGHEAAALARMREGLELWHATGSELGHAYFLTLMAEIYGVQGDVDTALQTLLEAQTFADQTKEYWWEAELYRLKGELCLTGDTPNPAEAETCFARALDIAQQQGAKSLELRVVLSLSRLRQSQGRTDDIRPMLQELYEGFSEGFDTADLQAAKVLLDQL